jgi:hypothetical protein
LDYSFKRKFSVLSRFTLSIRQIIQDKFPHNKINWNKTFIEVERKDYVEKYGDLKDEINQTGESIEGTLYGKIKESQEDDIGADNELSLLVTKNLMEYQIMF